MARQVSVVILLVLAVISCAFAGETRRTAEAGTVQLLDIPKAGAASGSGLEGSIRKFSKKTTAAEEGTVQMLDIPKASGATASAGRLTTKKAAAEEGTVQMLDIPKASGATASAGRLTAKKAAAEEGTVQMLDVKAAAAPATAATTTATSSTKSESSEGGVKFLNILKPLSNLFGSGDTTTSTTVPKPAVQFLEPATAVSATTTTASAATAESAVATKPAAGTVQLLDTDAATATTSTKASTKPQFVDMTTADANTLVGASAASKAKTSYLRKSESALAASSADSTASTTTTSAASPKYTKSFTTGAYSDVTDVLQKKIQQTGKALDASETLEGSLKLADLLVKLSEALNNLAGK